MNALAPLPEHLRPAFDRVQAIARDYHVVVVGPHGVGKTMIARRVDAAWPRPESWGDRWVAGLVWWLVRGRPPCGTAYVDRSRYGTPDVRAPFRAPHHTVSLAGLMGGGSPVRPGEVTLAHGGILYLDEIGEFSRSALDALREPMDSGEVTIVRARGVRRYPARFRLIASTTPCPCGYLGHADRACVCSPLAVQRHRTNVHRLTRRPDVVVVDFTGTWGAPTVNVPCPRRPRV